MPNTAGSSPSLYDRAVTQITEWVKPSLRDITSDFIVRAVDQHAKEEPRYARMIEFEVRRRGDGAGLTQDVSEPLLWAAVKTAAALAIAGGVQSLQSNKLKMVGYATSLGIVLNNAVEVLRVVPRFKAGLQGSLEMAKDRWESIQQTGIDPFVHQSRQINDPAHATPTAFTEHIAPKQKVAPRSTMEAALSQPSGGIGR